LGHGKRFVDLRHGHDAYHHVGTDVGHAWRTQKVRVLIMSISVRNLVKTYGSVQVIKDISFDVSDGEFVTLLGPSGCGKTTSLRCIAGLENVDEGQITINDRVVSDGKTGVFVPPDQRNLGMVFQSYAIWPHLTVAQNVAFPLTVRGQKDTASDVKWALDIVGLNHLANRRPSELSGGQQQRVALARAIAGRPQVLLFDEPLSNLDARLRDRTRLEISRIHKELKVPAIYVTHDQTEALSMSDRVIVMNGGEIAQTGTAIEVYNRPVNRFVADFIGNANFLKVKREGDHWQMKDGTRIDVCLETLLNPDEPKAVLIRPEAIEVQTAISQAGSNLSDSLNQLSGTVVSSMFLGHHYEHIVDVADTLVRAHSRSPIETGHTIRLRFAAADCRLVHDNS
jgi:iron(III) transport system ATP-binding protein